MMVLKWTLWIVARLAMGASAGLLAYAVSRGRPDAIGFGAVECVLIGIALVAGVQRAMLGVREKH